MCGVSLITWCTIGAICPVEAVCATVVDHRDHIGDVNAATSNSTRNTGTEILIARRCFFMTAPLLGYDFSEPIVEPAEFPSQVEPTGPGADA
jgi:hypothetical protein